MPTDKIHIKVPNNRLICSTHVDNKKTTGFLKHIFKCVTRPDHRGVPLKTSRKKTLWNQCPRLVAINRLSGLYLTVCINLRFQYPYNWATKCIQHSRNCSADTVYELLCNVYVACVMFNMRKAKFGKKYKYQTVQPVYTTMLR